MAKTAEKRAPQSLAAVGARTPKGAPSSVPNKPTADNDGGIPIRDHFLLTEVEVAEMCGVSRWSVRRWMKAGLLVPVALPWGQKRNLYRSADVEAFLAGLGEG